MFLSFSKPKKLGIFFFNFFSFSVNWTYFSAFLDFFYQIFLHQNSWRINNTMLNPDTPKKRKSSHKISKHFPVGKAREEKSFSKKLSRTT
jgi:hypothetical protein